MSGRYNNNVNLGDAQGVDESDENKAASNPPTTRQTQLRTWRDTVRIFNKEHPDTGEIVFVLFAGCGIFGAIHFLAWKAEMPTPAEVTIWRLAAVFLTTFPFSALLAFMIPPVLKLKKNGFWDTILILFISLGSLMHPLLRAIVALDALALLRQLPDTAYRDLSWSDVIPSL